MVQSVAYASRRQRPGWAGRPDSPIDLRGALLGLVRLVAQSRADVGVVAPETCVALMLFFSNVGAVGSVIDSMEPLPPVDEALKDIIVETRPGVATRKSMVALRTAVHELTRNRDGENALRRSRTPRSAR